MNNFISIESKEQAENMGIIHLNPIFGEFP